MLQDKSVLIVEDNIILGLALATAVEDVGGRPVGPIPTVSEARSIIAAGHFSAAILDANLDDRDVSPLALELLDRGVPFLIYTGVGLPAELAAAYPHISVLMKPVPPQQVVDRLSQQLARFENPQPEASTETDSEKFSVPGETDHAKLQMIADALVLQLGDRAALVAQRQLSQASGETRSSWMAIAALIRDRTVSKV